MLFPLRSGELDKLIPAVATGNQFNAALGNPRKILQRILVSSIGGVITLLIAQGQVASQFYSVWLITGVIFLLYILWGPIIEAGRKNAKLRLYPFAAVFQGTVADIFLRERVENRQEQANKLGELELVESRRTWMFLELEDDDGYLGEIKFPMEKEHQSIKKGSTIRCLVLSARKDFGRIDAFSDAWIPGKQLWVGEYPYLLRPAFEDFCRFKLR